MKKIVIILAVAVATIFAFSSCQKENFQDNGSASGVRTISAEFENKATKTTLNSDGITPEWEEGDKIRILSETTFEDITLTTDNIENDGRTITFNTNLIGTLYAVYPANATSLEKCDDGKITFSIPATQEGTFAGANICVAKSTEDDETNIDNLIFRNATAVLEITTPDNVIKLEFAADNPIAGTVTASFDDTAVSLSTSDLNNKSISANVSIAPSGNRFYLAVAPVTTGSTTVSCSTSEKKGSATKDSKDLRRNVIYSMDLSDMDLPDPACVAAGTKITMANGERKAVEEMI